MQITINEKLIPTLTRLASEQNISVEQCVVKNIEAYLLSQYKLDIVRKIENKSLEDIATIETEVVRIDAAIKVRDYVAPIEKVVELPIEEVIKK